jgi:hypothetical protein
LESNNIFLLTFSKYSMYFIWRCKLNKTLPNWNNFLNDMYYQIETVRLCCASFREQMQLNLNICRTWNAEADRRR